MQANSKKVTGAPTASTRERKVTLTKKLEDQLANELMLAPGARTRVEKISAVGVPLMLFNLFIT